MGSKVQKTACRSHNECMGELGNERDTGVLERLRYAELEAARPWLPRDARVLELGGGNGYQASVLTKWGYEVTSVDVVASAPGQPQYHEVLLYDGRQFPFRGRYFDVVFSSNVLEHIKDLEAVLRETRRVLRPGGISIHIVPSATWRLWTSLSLYGFVVKTVWARLIGARSRSPLAAFEAAEAPRMKWWELMARALYDRPHGEFPSVRAELIAFRRVAWRKRFVAMGFNVRAAIGNRLFYTGYALLPHLPIMTRRRLSRLLGSSCHLFVVE